MEKKTTSANIFYTYADTSGADAVQADNLYTPGYKNLLEGFINTRAITTSLLQQTLDGIFNRGIKRGFDILFSYLTLLTNASNKKYLTQYDLLFPVYFRWRLHSLIPAPAL